MRVNRSLFYAIFSDFTICNRRPAYSKIINLQQRIALPISNAYCKFEGKQRRGYCITPDTPTQEKDKAHSCLPFGGNSPSFRPILENRIWRTKRIGPCPGPKISHFFFFCKIAQEGPNKHHLGDLQEMSIIYGDIYGQNLWNISWRSAQKFIFLDFQKMIASSHPFLTVILPLVVGPRAVLPPYPF